MNKYCRKLSNASTGCGVQRRDKPAIVRKEIIDNTDIFDGINGRILSFKTTTVITEKNIKSAGLILTPNIL
jgi:hypothetical protein